MPRHGRYIIGACVAVTVVSFNLLFSTTSTSYYTPIQIPNSNNNLLIPKPLAKLLIHAGPPKTGTTTLQAKLSNGKFRKKLLDKDNVAVLTNYGYIQFREFSKGCFLQPTKLTNKSYCEKEETLWDVFFNLLKQTAGITNLSNYDTNGTIAIGAHGDTTKTIHSVIHSVETYSNLPDTIYTVQKLRSLQNVFDVKVIVFYRRPVGWFASYYKQVIKASMYRSRSGRYNGWESERDTPEEVFEKNHWRDTLDTVQFYSKVFGTNNVKVLDYHASDLEVEFFCGNGITPGVCDYVKESQNTVKKATQLNTNDFLLFDEDLLAMQAYRDGYFSPSQAFINRHEVTLKIRDFLDLNYTRDTLPKMCLSANFTKWMWNRTVLLESTIAPHPVSDENALREEFDVAIREKHCEVDATRLLKIGVWKRFLASCDFVRPSIMQDVETKWGTICKPKDHNVSTRF